MEELQNSLEAHEQQVNEGQNGERAQEQALQAQTSHKNKGVGGSNKKKEKWKGGRSEGADESLNGQNQYHIEHDHGEYSNRRSVKYNKSHNESWIPC